MKKILLLFCLAFGSSLSAQQDFFYGLQLDYGIFNRSFDQNRDVLKGSTLGRMINVGASFSYRIFDQLTLEGGARLNGMKWNLRDKNFEERNPGFEALSITNNRFMSFYGSLKYSQPLGRKQYLFFKTSYEHSAIGAQTITRNKRFSVSDEFVETTFTYGQNNQALVPEIGFEYFNTQGNLISFGLKYHYKFGGDNLLRSDYFVNTDLGDVNSTNINDGFDLSGSYVALSVQFNGLITHIAKKERVKKPRTKNTPLPDPVLVDTTPAKIDTSVTDVVVDNKTADNRDYKITNKVKVSSSKVKIIIWDHQIEDGDRVNLILNGQQILTDYTLKNKKLEIEVELNEGQNDFILYALNLGRYKPNTAAVIIDDGNKQSKVILESTLKESGAIEIKFIK